eukprot:scaffold1435_cov267-Pinguiococcus_pyrenoidosus.AAC.36
MPCRRFTLRYSTAQRASVGENLDGLGKAAAAGLHLIHRSSSTTAPETKRPRIRTEGAGSEHKLESLPDSFVVALSGSSLENLSGRGSGRSFAGAPRLIAECLRAGWCESQWQHHVLLRRRAALTSGAKLSFVREKV